MLCLCLKVMISLVGLSNTISQSVFCQNEWVYVIGVYKTTHRRIITEKGLILHTTLTRYYCKPFFYNFQFYG